MKYKNPRFEVLDDPSRICICHGLSEWPSGKTGHVKQFIKVDKLAVDDNAFYNQGAFLGRKSPCSAGRLSLSPSGANEYCCAEGAFGS